ncbi:uncharacterized protein LOC105839956 [Monomorium pharaonis]|uniref:uncharacterized protein LOC105839956 n=1 Tax=Monomorium pharaonis TaxID=307658 RepID=UPI00063F54AB|nr:uncharacterized protein LOC105839956 [Monomorium pharaonis]
MDTDCSNSSNSDLPIQETKYFKQQSIFETISTLKKHVSLLENTIKIFKVNYSQIKRETLKSLDGEAGTSYDKLDVQMELYHDIYQFARVQCISFERDSRFIFEISNPESIVKNNSYTIEVLIDDDGYGKLGKCVLPDFINVNDILWQYPIDDLNNVKHFLKSCKHNIDCYFRRLKQVNELKNLFLKIQNGSIYHNNDFTLMELILYNIEDVYTNDIHDVITYLYYHADETRPYKLSANTIEADVRPPFFYKRLSMYFMPFIKNDLSSAFIQIVNSYVEFIWQKVIVENEDNVEIFECKATILYDDEKNTEYVDYFLCRRDRSSERNEDKMQLKISLDNDDTETETYSVKKKEIYKDQILVKSTADNFLKENKK